ncbi:hypothetical protein [Solitalea canadensis]|uniref:Uncharacterized protein n=1 Tax=Solitalea canadensis (strain ATCC 29591 / DSM 3403 / JCM 21819 / LMG 8368 / NBRC 15130 / NCIMB 12057 / USAM 9D) TaxID=929556 RepID=H8KXP4_SOLCM|nr:hypothetical protein [Solitalea canadensis]AFD05459.1 hypothetical protein Solca_0316 [Solitalea canadensis DSM 3403]
MKKAFKIIGWVIGIFLIGAGTIFLVAWKSPAFYKVQKRSPLEQAYVTFIRYSGEHPRPYIIETQGAIIFGAEHTRNPQHREIKMIEEKWKTLKPSIALVEGRLGFLLPGLMDPVANLGEGGKVKQLAEKDDIPIYNWDLSKEELAIQLKSKFSNEQIALAQILQPYFSQLRFGKPSSEADFLQPFFKRAAIVGLEDSIKSVQDIDKVWKKYFSTIDWRNVSDETTLPGYLNDMLAVTNDLRNQQLISVVNELVSKGERVFLICGSSHAYCVGPAFKADK